jgi:hypothetical protein
MHMQSLHMMWKTLSSIIGAGHAAQDDAALLACLSVQLVTAFMAHLCLQHFHAVLQLHNLLLCAAELLLCLPQLLQQLYPLLRACAFGLLHCCYLSCQLVGLLQQIWDACCLDAA